MRRGQVVRSMRATGPSACISRILSLYSGWLYIITQNMVVPGEGVQSVEMKQIYLISNSAKPTTRDGLVNVPHDIHYTPCPIWGKTHWKCSTDVLYLPHSARYKKKYWFQVTTINLIVYAIFSTASFKLPWEKSNGLYFEMIPQCRNARIIYLKTSRKLNLSEVQLRTFSRVWCHRTRPFRAHRQWCTQHTGIQSMPCTFGFGAPIRSVCGGMTAFDAKVNQHAVNTSPRNLAVQVCMQKSAV